MTHIRKHDVDVHLLRIFLNAKANLTLPCLSKHKSNFQELMLVIYRLTIFLNIEYYFYLNLEALNAKAKVTLLCLSKHESNFQELMLVIYHLTIFLNFEHYFYLNLEAVKSTYQHGTLRRIRRSDWRTERHSSCRSRSCRAWNRTACLPRRRGTWRTRNRPRASACPCTTGPKKKNLFSLRYEEHLKILSNY